MANQKSSSVRLRVEGAPLDHLNGLSDQLGLSRTQIVTLLIETATAQDIANALVHRKVESNQKIQKKN